MPSRKRERAQDAIQLLRQDHDEVKQMFEEFESADEDRKFELAAEICQALTVHAAIEDEIFYPQVREVLDAEDLMAEAEIEHDTVKQLIERVQAGEVEEIQLTAMGTVLKEYVDHHVNEEQRKMFPRVRRADLDLNALGQELRARKTELAMELQDATLDDPDEADANIGSTDRRRGMAARDATDDEA